MRGTGVQGRSAHLSLAWLPRWDSGGESVSVMWAVCKRLEWAMLCAGLYAVSVWCVRGVPRVPNGLWCVSACKKCVWYLSIALGDCAKVTQGFHVCAHGTLVRTCVLCSCVLRVAHPWPHVVG